MKFCPELYIRCQDVSGTYDLTLHYICNQSDLTPCKNFEQDNSTKKWVYKNKYTCPIDGGGKHANKKPSG
jgi:hypothetical protein